MASVEERFWTKVEEGEPHEHWPWTGARSGKYGHLWDPEKGRATTAHRVSWEIHHGPVPAGKRVLSCSEPWCVNPFHLQLASVADPEYRDRSQRRN